MKLEKGYYKVKFYNHSIIVILFWTGEKFEKFPSDPFIPHDEIEYYKKLELKNKQ